MMSLSTFNALSLINVQTDMWASEQSLRADDDSAEGWNGATFGVTGDTILAGWRCLLRA